ncbi:MAG: hypothetical protein CM15mP130_1130 [Verrucomicrobiota bacterium]|nr:MAG: hypothetical protein CM15mP130_1130 [Verrucomicrobiota bacterium]
MAEKNDEGHETWKKKSNDPKGAPGMPRRQGKGNPENDA